MLLDFAGALDVLLKSLWRKASRNPDARAGTENPQGEPQDLTRSLNYTSEYHLRRLRKLIELRYREDYSTDNDAGLRHLIRFASRVQEPDIQRELLLFYLNCPPKLQAQLRAGDMLDAGHYLKQAPDHNID